MSLRKYYLLIILIMLFCSFLFIYKWQSPGLNINYIKSTLDCINQAKDLKNIEIVSFPSNFKIKLARADNQCLTPYFPAIQIEADPHRSHRAWLQIVHTDSNNEELKIFLDSGEDDWPFYNHKSIFYDSPLWTYKLWYKPISYWEAHAYSVDIVDNNIKFLGGIKWGFSLSNYKIRPTITQPSTLSLSDFQKDIKRIKNFPYALIEAEG
jgi:hypothetical protein